MTLLAAEHLSIVRDGRPIVDRVSMTLSSGSFVALIGPNGAGKSTLLSCLAGLLKPDSGQVTLDGTVLSAIGLRALAQRRAYLPQSPRAEWPVSVERLVALGLIPQLPAFGGLPDVLAERVAEALAQVDLLSHRDQPANTLSGGELARAMLARALVGQPEIILADEPLTGLDPRHAIDGMKRLRDLAQAGKLVIASLHDLTLAARYATHVAVIRDGRLIAFGESGQTLAADLIQEAFDVQVRVRAPGSAEVYIDFL